ncbi:solute carrier family 22 member 4-like [Styela clava]
MSYDDILNSIGGWGKYQKWICLLLTLSTIPNGYFTMILVFTSKTPEHRCRIPEIDGLHGENATLTPFNVSGLSEYIPWDSKNNRFDRCLRYNLTAKYGFNETQNTTGCDFGYVYDIVEGQLTAVTEWDLVCNYSYVKPRISSVFMAGVLFGSLICGVVADGFGRWPLMIASTYLQFIFMGLNIFNTSPAMYAAFMFFAGGCSLNNFVAAIVIGAEICDKKHRAFMETSAMIGFCVGYMVIPLFAYFILEWKTLFLVTAAIGVVYIPYWWLIPESPRWLITKNKFIKAKLLLKKIAKFNGVNEDIDTFFTDENLFLMSNDSEKEEKSISDSQGNEKCWTKIPYIQLFTHPGMISRTLYSCCSWFVIALTYYTLSLNTGNMGGNDYINCFVSACVEIPAYLSVYFLLRRKGRRTLMISYLLAGSAGCIITPLIMRVSDIGGIVTAMIGKFFVTSAFGLVYLYTAEMFPTVSRNQALGITSMFARFGSVIAPYIIYLGDTNGRELPYTIIGSFSLASALLNCLLPETAGTHLPDTYEEALEMKSGRCMNLRKRVRKHSDKELKEDDDTSSVFAA